MSTDIPNSTVPITSTSQPTPSNDIASATNTPSTTSITRHPFPPFLTTGDWGSAWKPSTGPPNSTQSSLAASPTDTHPTALRVSRLSAAAIAGVAVGVGIIVVTILMLSYCLYHKRRARNDGLRKESIFVRRSEALLTPFDGQRATRPHPRSYKNNTVLPIEHVVRIETRQRGANGTRTSTPEIEPAEVEDSPATHQVEPLSRVESGSSHPPAYDQLSNIPSRLTRLHHNEVHT